MEENKSLQTELKTKHLGQQLVDELTAPTPEDKVKLRKGRGGYD